MNQPTPQSAQPPRGDSRPGQGGRPGAGGQQRRRTKTRYGTQMAEKQQLKGIYNIREQKLRNYFKEAYRIRGATGEQLISLLERRLDNVVYRAGFAPTRATARQMVSHGFFQVNGKGVDVASYRVRPNDVITIKTGKRGKSHFANFPKSLQNVNVPSWLALNTDAYSVTVTGNPLADEAQVGVDIQAIVEFLSR